MPGIKTAYLSLGSNLGDRNHNLERALVLLSDRGVSITKQSSLYETAPRELVDQPWFLNIAIETETTLFPLQLLSAAQSIERELGRDRSKGPRFGPRSLDIDILLFGRAVIDGPDLTVPHPRMRERRFVLEPLLEIAPDLKDPVTGRAFRDFLPSLMDQEIRRLASR